MQVGDKPAAQSKTMKGGVVSTIALILLQLLQSMRDWLMLHGWSESMISFVESLLTGFVGGGGLFALYGLRKSQGEAKVAAENAETAASGAEAAAENAAVTTRQTQQTVVGAAVPGRKNP